MKKLICLFVLTIMFFGKGFGQGDTIQILPVDPTINDSIKLITYSCNFDSTGFAIHQDTIIFLHTTDSRIAAPCALSYDTVNIGKLEEGDWILHYYYIDKAINDKDSILYSEIIYFHVSGPAGISVKEDVPGWKVYPLPAKDDLNIDLEENHFGSCFVNIYSCTGQLRLKSKAFTNHTSIEIKGFPPGMYIYQILRTTNHGIVGQGKLIIP